MVYSSGSTGRPKGVMHAHRDMVTGIETYARHVLELAPGEPCHSAAKLFTSLGFGNGFFRVLGVRRHRRAQQRQAQSAHDDRAREPATGSGS